MELLIDKPIEKSIDDKLGRKDFCKYLAKSLLTTKNKDGYVVLLDGKWGTGKTSIVNLIKEEIRIQISNNVNLNYLPIIDDFKPWNVTNQDAMISQFFNVISSSFQVNRIKKILQSVNRNPIFREICGVINRIPLINTTPAWKAIKCLNEKFQAYIKSINDNKNLCEKKNEIIATLQTSLTRHIVFIDDLDRLNDEEIKLIFQLIKSVCNFPNVIYVIAADSDVLKGALKNEQSSNATGEEYLDKIIQAKYDLPLLKEDTIQAILLKDLGDAIGSDITDFDTERFQLYQYYGLFKSIHTLREEKKYLNAFFAAYDLYLDELDVVDLIAITYLRFLSPKIIQILCDYSDYLFGVYSINRDKNLQDFSKKFKADLNSVSINDEIYNFINAMFPYMFSFVNGDDKIFLTKRICSRNKFSLYLTLLLDADDLSINKFANVMKNSSYEQLAKFNEGLKPLQGRRFLQHLVNYVNRLPYAWDADFVLKFWFLDYQKIKFEYKTFFVTKDYYLKAFIREMCNRFSANEVYKCVIKYINNQADIGALTEFATDLALKKDEKFYSFSNEENGIIMENVCEIICQKLKNHSLLYPRKAYSIRLVFEQYPDKLKECFNSFNVVEKARLFSDMVWVGTMSEGIKKHATFSCRRDWIQFLSTEKELQTIYEKAFSSLENREKQRLLIVKMSDSNFTTPHHSDNLNVYTVEEIKKYCLEKKIDFITDELYEM